MKLVGRLGGQRRVIDDRWLTEFADPAVPPFGRVPAREVVDAETEAHTPQNLVVGLLLEIWHQHILVERRGGRGGVYSDLDFVEKI